MLIQGYVAMWGLNNSLKMGSPVNVTRKNWQDIRMDGLINWSSILNDS